MNSGTKVNGNRIKSHSNSDSYSEKWSVMSLAKIFNPFILA